MYEGLKRIAKGLLPKGLLQKYEVQFRYAVALFYSGNTFACNICGKKNRKFVLLTNGERLCPFCGSLPRSRRLYHTLAPKLLPNYLRVLHFSPSKSLDEKLRAHFTESYTTSDYIGEFKADKQLDITCLSEPDNSYDLIICYHILEHILEDSKAMRELFRVLAAGGKCFIQTPYKAGDTFEDYTITSAVERKKHFGQEDHVRVYSVQGLKKRLQAVGFAVELLTFTESPQNYFGFKENESILVASK
ncbi:methyltransferase domain-containing protein [Pontibacter sp. H249]|uniref:methyltransferase domain-containing protein n=1 Tax=Pontibacter sp. H249 TaxID=3133420 RepID=UPI0030BD694C